MAKYWPKRKKKPVESDRFAESHTHGPVRVVYSSTGWTQVEPVGKKGELATKMRENPPKSERLMYEALLRRIDTTEWPIWFQHVLHGYIVDFYFPKQRLVLEVNGPIHARPDRKAHDRIRLQVLRANGHRIHRVPAFLTYKPEDLERQVEQVIQRLKDLTAMSLSF